MLVLQLFLLQGARAAARLAEPPPAVLVEARLLALASPVDLTVESGGSTWQFSVRGVRDDPVCQPERHLAWARRVLPVGTRLQLGGADAWGARSVRFAWNGRVLDWAFVLLRAGQAFPGGAPGEPARLPESYAWAAREARAEGRGIWGECGRALQRFRPLAARRGIPAEVLYGVAMAESALSGAPWPWTLNVAGRPLRFPSRREAWTALRAIERTGEQRLDIGLMQVNWHYHAGRFASLWEALDPDVNQEVAADILCEEWRRSGSLALAVARYHSARPDAGRQYLQRVSAFAKSSPGGLSLSAQPQVADAPGCGP
ncbi:MAG: hypothetical protein KGI67_03020 [Pseudomonadota bacterium]|nr:hypothetical protein [Pseudomonadota bacterium]